jgi:hypothetical protein
MGAMNQQKVIVGGLVAGIILIVLDYVSGSFVLGPWAAGHADAVNAALTATMNSKRAIVGGIVTDLCLGWSLVWCYAAIRPRYGAGARTAMCAGSFIWFVFMLAMGSYYLYRMSSITFVLIAALVSLIQMLIAVYVGAMMYSEAGGAQA